MRTAYVNGQLWLVNKNLMNADSVIEVEHATKTHYLMGPLQSFLPFVLQWKISKRKILIARFAALPALRDALINASSYEDVLSDARKNEK